MLLPLCVAEMATVRWRRAILAVLVVALAAERGWTGAAVVIALVAAAAIAGSSAALPRRVPKQVLQGVAAAVVVSLLVGGFFAQRRYLRDRYIDTIGSNPFFDAASLNAMYEWARGVSHARIGIVGVQYQYPLFGLDVTNDVRYIGVRGNAGNFRHAENCREWRQLVSDGHFDYVVTAPRGLAFTQLEGTWTEGPSVREVLRAREATVFKVRAPLDPDACPPNA
jgi:hypothetical protein